MSFNLEIALDRVSRAKKYSKLSKQTRMNYRLFDRMAAEGKLADSWLNIKFEEFLSKEEKLNWRAKLESMRKK